MGKLWFQNSKGQKRVIAEVNDFNEVFSEIHKFLEKNNYKSYYTRFWEEDGMTKFDVGSHTEFFFWEGKYAGNS